MCNLPALFANLCTSNASKFMAFVVFQYNYIQTDLWVRDDSARSSLSRGLEPEQGCWIGSTGPGEAGPGCYPSAAKSFFTSSTAERIWRYMALGDRDGIEFCPEPLQPLEGERWYWTFSRAVVCTAGLSLSLSH